ncbi:MAG: ABC transporter ATP-binding protein [Bacteroidales bacterium]|jgi:ABC-2 type transport system ATP-binding protein|nr:ABC transporter ATP-binding protein [Bacteroidales bacterium]
MEKALQINNLSKNYNNIKAIEDISLTIKKGEVYGLLGPNGSGKTTTLGIILGVLKANRGNYKWFDNNKSHKCKIGSLLETPNFYPYLSLYDNLKIVATIKNADEKDITNALGLTNLLTRKYSKFKNLSLGMKQRLAIASTLIGDPEILIFDEPTNGLDPEGFKDIRNIIKSESEKGKTIILASHILDEVEKVCSHVGVLKSGKLIANGKVTELLTASDLVYLNSENKEALLELINKSDMVTKIVETNPEIIVTLNSNSSASDFNKYAFNKGIVLNKIFTKAVSLEKQFLVLVK